jgi:hypothetical protein
MFEQKLMTPSHTAQHEKSTILGSEKISKSKEPLFYQRYFQVIDSS